MSPTRAVSLLLHGDTSQDTAQIGLPGRLKMGGFTLDAEEPSVVLELCDGASGCRNESSSFEKFMVGVIANVLKAGVRQASSGFWAAQAA